MHLMLAPQETGKLGHISRSKPSLIKATQRERDAVESAKISLGSPHAETAFQRTDDPEALQSSI